MKSMNLTVIMPTYNRAKLLKENMKAILKSVFSFELLIMDDCSQDETEEVVRSFKDQRITYHRHSLNCGQAKSINDGIELARNSLIMICEDDAFIPNPDKFFKILISESRGEKIIGTRLLTNGEELKPNFLHKIERFFANPLCKEVYVYNGHKRKVVEFCNACLAFHRDVVKTRFEERDYYYVRNAFRIESDFQYRARLEGNRIVYDPELVIDHKHYLTGGHRVRTKDSFHFQCMVNHMIFLGKFYSYWNIWIYATMQLLAHPSKRVAIGKALQTYIRLSKKISHA